MNSFAVTLLCISFYFKNLVKILKLYGFLATKVRQNKNSIYWQQILQEISFSCFPMHLPQTNLEQVLHVSRVC